MSILFRDSKNICKKEIQNLKSKIKSLYNNGKIDENSMKNYIKLLKIIYEISQKEVKNG
jgi:uncharacterized protein YueI